MGLSWFHNLDPSWIVLALVTGMMLAAEVGYRVGLRTAAPAADKGRFYFNAVMGSMLGLVALLLSFSFNMSAQRFDARRQLVVEDANALSTVYMQSSLLPEPERRQFKQEFRRYVDKIGELSLLQRTYTEEQLPSELAQIAALYRRMWELVRTMAQEDPPVKGSQDILASLDDAQTVGFRRIFAYLSRVPRTIIGFLLGALLVVTFAIGFAGGMGQYRGLLARSIFTLLASGVIFIILNLDQPRRGIIRVDQSPMLFMKEMVDRDPETVP